MIRYFCINCRFLFVGICGSVLLLLLIQRRGEEEMINGVVIDLDSKKPLKDVNIASHPQFKKRKKPFLQI